jgi:hypothetical protein
LRTLAEGSVAQFLGKRGGLRVIYYYWNGGPEFWLFTLYGKNEITDLSPKQRAELKERMKGELKTRRKTWGKA